MTRENESDGKTKANLIRIVVASCDGAPKLDVGPSKISSRIASRLSFVLLHNLNDNTCLTP